MPVNQQLSDALRALEGQIKAAEEVLKKLPARGRGYVDLLTGPAAANLPFDYCVSLTTFSDGTICVEYLNDGETSNEVLRDLRVGLRIQYAAKIPELIQATLDAEPALTEEAIKAAVAIEQALAELAA